MRRHEHVRAGPRSDDLWPFAVSARTTNRLDSDVRSFGPNVSRFSKRSFEGRRLDRPQHLCQQSPELTGWVASHERLLVPGGVSSGCRLTACSSVLASTGALRCFSAAKPVGASSCEIERNFSGYFDWHRNFGRGHQRSSMEVREALPQLSSRCPHFAPDADDLKASLLELSRGSTCRTDDRMLPFAES